MSNGWNPGVPTTNPYFGAAAADTNLNTANRKRAAEQPSQMGLGSLLQSNKRVATEGAGRSVPNPSFAVGQPFYQPMLSTVTGIPAHLFGYAQPRQFLPQSSAPLQGPNNTNIYHNNGLQAVLPQPLSYLEQPTRPMPQRLMAPMYPMINQYNTHSFHQVQAQATAVGVQVQVAPQAGQAFGGLSLDVQVAPAPAQVPAAGEVPTAYQMSPSQVLQASQATNTDQVAMDDSQLVV